MQAQIAFDKGQPQQEAPPQKAPEQKQEAPQQGAQQSAEAQQTEKPAKEGPWSKLGKPPEKEKEQTSTDGDDYDGDTPPTGDKAQTAWMKRKHRIKELEAKEQEWTKRQAEYDAKLKEYEARTSEFKSEDMEALKRYRENEAIDYVQKTPDYLEKAQKPWDEANHTLMEVVGFTDIPLSELQRVLQQPNSLIRNEEIAALIETSKREMSDARKAAVVDAVFQAGEKMNRAAEEHKRMIAEAGQKKEQRDLAEKASQLKAKEEAQKVFRSSVAEITEGMKGQLADLIEDGTFSKDVFDNLSNIELSDDPMDRGFGEISANLLVGAIAELRKAKAEIKQLRADAKARIAARPGLKNTNGTSTNGEPPAMELRDAMKAHLAYTGGAGFGR